MKGKDISNLPDSPLTLRFAFPIPFTKTVVVICTGRVSLKPLEDKPPLTPLERQKKHFDNADPKLGDQAAHEAAMMLGVNPMEVNAGKATKHVWISWKGITWNDTTWLLVLKHVARHQVAQIRQHHLKQRGKKPGEQN